MKFWELISAFRSEKDNLKSILSNARWRKYEIYFNDMDSIVAKQDRLILDEEIPFQLAKEVCGLSKLKFYLYYKDNPHILSSYKQDTENVYEELSALDILVRFGGSYIEDALEFGTSKVAPREIGKDIEVLGVCKLTGIGIVAFLRTENYILQEGCLISAFDNKRKWVVKGEPFMFIDPYPAHEKRERQSEQGIRLYRITPINGSGKLKETEVLKLE